MTSRIRPPVYAPRCAVATAHPLATEAALRILREGGSAADAAVAAGAVLTVVEPWASHLGGDAFALAWDAARGRARAIQGSGAAPRGTPDAASLRDAGGVPMRGALPTTVPGMIGAWFHLLATRGRLGVARVFSPAIELAAGGAPASGRWERVARIHHSLIAEDPGLAALFSRDGRPLAAGARIVQEDLARTLEGLARGGAEEFYAGELGRKVVAAIRARGGVMDEADLAAHVTEETDPLRIDSGADGVAVLEQPPVSQGVLVLTMLRVLEEADRRGWSLPAGEARGIARAMHLEVEAYRRVRTDRDRWLGDPRAVRIEEALEGRLSREFAAACCAGIDPERASAPSAAAVEVRDTTYLCVVDASGDAVSWIQSIFHPFGSGWIVPGTGMLLNNRMTGFSLEDGAPNRLAPGKRTVHTLNTWMVLRDGSPWLVGGTPGGEAQVQVNVQVLRGRITRGMSMAEAIHAPRWRIDEQGRVAVEGRLPREARRRLERAGHPVVRIGPWDGTGFYQAIERLPEGGWLACTDPRGEGLAAGF